MSRDAEFLERWEREEPRYRALGSFIVRSVIQRISDKIAVPPEIFFKIAPGYRTKEANSLLEKAFYRNKNYPNPFEDITDKVGARFVPLLGSQIGLIEKALQSIPELAFRLDRDYQEEQKQKPVEFDYAAKHYVVWPQSDLQVDGVTVSAGTPCEVQIKNVLQHAYSEMSHDTIYKSQVGRTPEMLRNAAKAMALLEATNDYFEKVDTQVSQALESVRSMTAKLSDLYRELVRISPQPSRLEGILLDVYENSAPPKFEEEIREMFRAKGWLTDRIRERVGQRNPIFRQPSVLLVYLDIYKRRARAKYDWPLTPDEMEPLLNDFGETAQN